MKDCRQWPLESIMIAEHLGREPTVAQKACAEPHSAAQAQQADLAQKVFAFADKNKGKSDDLK